VAIACDSLPVSSVTTFSVTFSAFVPQFSNTVAWTLVRALARLQSDA
jgi:hypothetical protein